MRKHDIVRFILPVFTLLLASFLFTSPASAAVFAKFDGIDGEAKAVGHEGWMDVISITESITRPSSGATGASRRRGAAIFNDLVLVKMLDKASVKLREYLAQGRVIPKLEIELTTNYGGPSVTYFRFELKNVMITSLSLNASVDTTSGPGTESLSVSFEEIIWTYTEFDDTGNAKGNIEASWKVEEGGV
jgi:type VI secretion system secreted protein Hcp